MRGLGNPEPPVRLEDVRELLRLDRQFYTTDDPSVLREVVSRIRVGALQVFERPMLLLDAVKKMSLQALYLPDRRRILLDGSLPPKKHRWSEGHEVLHSLIPWHDGAMLGDNRHTLTQRCYEQIEAEANYGTGRLLFLRERFVIEARDLPVKIASIQALHKKFGNTLSSTLWRFVEATGEQRPMLGMITCHPHAARRPAEFDPARPCRHCIQSTAFATMFGRVSETELFAAAASYCGAQSGGPLGVGEVVLADDNGERHVFRFESFFIKYKNSAGECLTLGSYLRPQAVAAPVLLAGGR